MIEFAKALFNRQLAPCAIRVALIVGTLLFAINHGSALMRGKMTRDRWASAVLTYIVPYVVNIHGQATSKKRDQNLKES